MIRNRLTVFSSIVCLCLMLGSSEYAHADRAAIQAEGSGTGAFFPATGYFFGPGTSTPLGGLIYNGTLELKEIQPLKFRFENAGRGTDNEIFHESIYEDGSTLSARFRGIVELDPVLDDEGNPTGQFTAEWTGNWVIVGGTGQFRGAKGSFRVTAINDPFFLTDFAWNFSWSWTGNIVVPNNPDDCVVLTLATQGEGVFDPANLGVGDPADFPFVIGDGLGEGIYNGTPVGEASLDGVTIGPDQHWGTAQSISPGIPSPASTIWFPGVTGENPRDDAGAQLIHIMATELGEIWFNYRYYFDLDLGAGVIVGRADFRVVGGTDMFEGAGGSVFVRVESSLEGFDPENPVAPFVYDFKGYIELCDDK